VWERRGAFRILVGKRDGKRPLKDVGVDRRTIYLFFKKWYGAMDWIDLAQGRILWRDVANSVINFRFS